VVFPVAITKIDARSTGFFGKIIVEANACRANVSPDYIRQSSVFHIVDPVFWGRES
jgi:hypothetical protein